MIVATEAVVVANIKSKKCSRKADLDTELALCFSAPDGETFFIPKPIDGIGYTIEHLNAIEDSLALQGFDLLPLDQNLN